MTDAISLLLPQHIEKLLENGRRPHEYMHQQPVIKLEIPNTPNIWLLTGITSDQEVYGMFRYNSDIIVGDINLNIVAQLDGIKTDQGFNPEYTLAVYFNVAKELGYIETDVGRNPTVWQRYKPI